MKNYKRLTALLLSILLIFSTVAISAFADDSTVEGIARVSVSINGDTATQRGFCWYTANESDSIVKMYQAGVDVTESVTLSTPVCGYFEGNYMHKVTVSGLTAGTTYQYKVGDGENWSDIGTFRTDDRDDKVNFIAIADVQASRLSSFLRSETALVKAAEYMPNYDFVANLGDFTNYSTNEEWGYYDEAFGPANLYYTIAPVSGNHDGTLTQSHGGFDKWGWFDKMFNLDTSESVQTINGVNYSFDYGNAHFAVLNTNDVFSVSNAQLKWLKNDMNSTDKDWKIVFMHKSPYTLGKDGKWPDALYLQKNLTKVFDETNVDMVMSGHDHMYLRTKPLYDNAVNEEGTYYVLSGTAGTKRYEIRSFMADTFMDTNFIDAMTIQEEGYANYWDPDEKDWDQSKDTNVGCCFNTVSIDGGTLTLNAYILADAPDENGNDVVTNIDTLTIEKEIGQNEITFTGDNTTDGLEYYLDVIPSFLSLARYAFLDWLPRFLKLVPEILFVYITEGVF